VALGDLLGCTSPYTNHIARLNDGNGRERRSPPIPTPRKPQRLADDLCRVKASEDPGVTGEIS
jgi:hypothetical protein